MKAGHGLTKNHTPMLYMYVLHWQTTVEDQSIHAKGRQAMQTTVRLFSKLMPLYTNKQAREEERKQASKQAGKKGRKEERKMEGKQERNQPRWALRFALLQKKMINTHTCIMCAVLPISN